MKDIDYRDCGYGLTTDRIVTSIKITKGGRYKIQFSCTYIRHNGEIEFCENREYSNGAIVGHSIIELF